tara:strand:+ start:428 stop:703 length:276 start_codon:yes stop_codon:yes gene_type:complete
MDEQEKAFKEYYEQKAQEDMADIEYRMERTNNPRVQREEEERLKELLRRKGVPVPGEQEVKRKKKKKTLVSKYNYKKGKAYAQSPRQVKTT